MVVLRLLLLPVLLLPACDSLLGKEEAPSERKKKEDAPSAESGDAGGESGGEPLTPQPLVRAEHKLRFPGKGGENMSFSLERLSKLRALAGAIEVPDWSAEGHGLPRLSRDDDLRTAWVCDPDEDHPCAIGLHFPEMAEVEIVRLYAATPGGKEPSARPQTVRVHTAEGWAEARLADDDRPWHVVLGEPIRSPNVILEVLDTHGEGPLHLAEIEVYGPSGPVRPPLHVDPSRAVVSFDATPWKSKLKTNTATPSFIEQVDVDGRLHRAFPGTALIGRAGDRMMLVEHAAWTTCDDGQGTYELIDLHTRVFVPLGDFGGFGEPAFAHAQGLGMALGNLDLDEGEVHAVVLDEGEYERRATDRLEKRTPRQMLESWGIDPTPLPRSDAHPLDDPPAGCSPARMEDLAALEPQLPKRTRIVAEQWIGCSLGGGSRLLMTTGGDCGREWHVGVIDGEGEKLGLVSGKEAGTHLRLRRLDGEAMLVELWGSKDDPRLLLADVDGVRELGRAGLSLRAPASCRKDCGAELGERWGK